MEGFVTRGVSVSALMDSMALTVRKVKRFPGLLPKDMEVTQEPHMNFKPSPEIMFLVTL